MTRQKKIYNKMLKHPEKLSVDTKMLVFENYADLYQLINDYEQSLHYINISFKFKDEVQANYIPYLYLNKAKIYWKLGNIEDAVNLVENGLILAEKVSKVETILDLHFLLIEIYLESNNYGKVKTILDQLEVFVTENNLKEILFNIYTYHIDLCYLTGEMKKCMVYTAKLRGLRNSGL